MEEKWIGEEDNTSGSYKTTTCSELSIRRGGMVNAKKLYRFTSRFGKEYNITDSEVINKIEELLPKEEEGDSVKLYEYLYNLVIEQFGIIEFIVDIGHKIAKERSDGYSSGKKQMQKDMRGLLGLR